MVIMAEISQLQHLLAVVEHGGFRRAAEAVHLTQPALTKSVQNLEESFGTPLLERRARPIVPTPFGEIVIAGARRIPSAAPPQPKVHDATRGEGGAALSSVGSLQPAAVTAALFAARTANITQLLAKAA